MPIFQHSLPGYRSGPWLPTVLLASLLLVLVGGCAVGPDYQEPEVALPDAWQSAAAADVDSSGAAIEDWWTALGDTMLESFIAEARQANLDLSLAVARIDEARAYHQIAGGDYWPQVQASGQMARVELAPNGPQGAAVAAGASNPSTNWEFGIGAGWEIDLFGKYRRAREATGAAVQASIEDYRDVMVSLFSEVAATYVEIRTLQSRLAFARHNVDSQRETMDIVVAREDAGLVPLLDVTRARSNLANTEASIPQLESALETGRNRLAILLGRHPGSLDQALDAPGAALVPSTDVVMELPAELLRRRPDVRASERYLAAQTARIGVATADLYPQFSLTGALTLQAGDFGDLGESDSFGWSLVPGVRWNLFTGGKVRGMIKVEEARARQALAAYEKTVLGALAEVENTLVALRMEETRRDLLVTAVESSQQSVELVHTQYLEGLTDFQSYLDAQRVLFSQQDQLAASRGQVVTNLVFLNRALGGGWSLDDPLPGQSPESEDMAANAGSPDESADKEEVNR
jgi:multidrug efflux system outer membrane protein